MKRSEILNTYVLKSLESSPNKYLISDDRMKLANVDGEVTKGWRMPRGRGRPAKAKVASIVNGNDAQAVVAVPKRGRGRPKKTAVGDPDAEWGPPPQPELEEDGDELV